MNIQNTYFGGNNLLYVQHMENIACKKKTVMCKGFICDCTSVSTKNV